MTEKAEKYNEWSQRPWNPVVGCRACGTECRNCYAAAFANRLAGMSRLAVADGRNPGRKAHYTEVVTEDGNWNGRVSLVESALDDPLGWKTPKRVFVCSMSDLFYEEVPEDFIQRVFAVMGQSFWHKFIVLTKRADRMREMSPRLPWRPNIAAGVSVGVQTALPRIDALRATDAHIKFLSLEPLIEPLPGLNLDGINWVVVGAESGQQARPLHPQWVRDVRDRCVEEDIPFFFKGFHAWLPEDHAQGKPDSWKNLVRNHTWPDGSRSLWIGQRSAGCLLDDAQWTQFPEGWADL